MIPCLASAIAWLPAEALEVAVLLRAEGAAGIEAAPGLFDRPLTEVTPRQVREVRTFWEGEGLPVRAMQALLFGRPELRLFGTEEERAALADYLRIVFRVAGGLGAGPLVFGSPKTRARGEMEPAAAFETAGRFFRQVAKDADAAGCVLCIEANAPDYGCDFVTTHEETSRLVKAVATPGFGLQVDTGVMRMNGESPADLAAILRAADVRPAHVHVSEPFLAPVEAATPFHRELAALLENLGYAGAVSVEMKRPESLPSLRSAVTSARATYGEPQ